jgi:VWFA-related protein
MHCPHGPGAAAEAGSNSLPPEPVCSIKHPQWTGLRSDGSNASSNAEVNTFGLGADFCVVTILTNRLKWPVVLAFFVLSSAVAPANLGEAPAATYRRTVAEVRLTFIATDEHNHNIDSLTNKDFAIVDNEFIVRNFRSFSRPDVAALDAILLVDSSESVLSHFKQEIIDVAQLLSQTQWVPDDHVSVLSFGGMQYSILCSGNCRRSSATDRLVAVSTGGATPLFDAVVFAANFVSQRCESGVRPVLIIFSDGDDTISRRSASEAFEAALASDAQIYAVDMNNPKILSPGTVFLQEMAGATGGGYFPMRDGAARVLSAVLEDLHAAYMVTYELPSREVGYHSVRILPTHNLSLRFRSRHGYYYRDNIR